LREEVARLEEVNISIIWTCNVVLKASRSIEKLDARH